MCPVGPEVQERPAVQEFPQVQEHLAIQDRQQVPAVPFGIGQSSRKRRLIEQTSDPPGSSLSTKGNTASHEGTTTIR
jgi:hypothetical protein